MKNLLMFTIPLFTLFSIHQVIAAPNAAVKTRYGQTTEQAIAEGAPTIIEYECENGLVQQAITLVGKERINISTGPRSKLDSTPTLNFTAFSISADQYKKKHKRSVPSGKIAYVGTEYPQQAGGDETGKERHVYISSAMLTPGNGQGSMQVWRKEYKTTANYTCTLVVRNPQ